MYIFEKSNTIAGMDTPGAVFASLFGSVTARTAGFYTVDTAALTNGSATYFVNDEYSSLMPIRSKPALQNADIEWNS